MVSHPQPLKRSHWTWTIGLGMAVLLLATAALPAGAGRAPPMLQRRPRRSTAPRRRRTRLRMLPSPRHASRRTTPANSSTPSPPPTSSAPRRAAPAGSPALPAPAVAGGRVVWMEVTAYCGCKKCCGPDAHGITASGHPITFNHSQFIAADTAVLPFFTRVIIPGYADGKPVPVIDRGTRSKAITSTYSSPITKPRWTGVSDGSR